MSNRSKLISIRMRNLGCVGDEGLRIELDNIVCLVGRNNAGKSTVLRAYQIAQKNALFELEKDRCIWAPDGAPTEIEMEVHIPKGIGNVDEKWKVASGDLLIVRSLWRWSPPEFTAVRKTWDPEINDWAEDGKAGGADNVFKSRLPRPLRIGSLDDAASTEDILLTLALSPLIERIEKERQDKESKLSAACDEIAGQLKLISDAHAEHFNKIAGKVATGFQGVFPDLNVKLQVGVAPLTTKLDSMVKQASGIRVSEGKNDTTLDQQGTGSRRALFWSMLQVYNEISREKEQRDAHLKALQKELETEKKKKGDKYDAAKVADLTAKAEAIKAGAPIPDSEDDPAFPGYLLLIDEPENALHPMAARAAQRHLYRLAESPDWQIMMTTHSPCFINPFEDHTTIVRLERRGAEENSSISPNIYRSDTMVFEGDSKKRLQALQQIDPSLAEIFFGSYPILVEGDTEHAAFIASIVERQDPLVNKVTVIRARGKAIIAPLISVMRHFKIDFGVVHDADPPFKKDGSANGMWTENEKIFSEVLKARGDGISVRHRISVPDFERGTGGGEVSKDKPLNTYIRVCEDADVEKGVRQLLKELLEGERHEPFEEAKAATAADFMSILREKVADWAKSAGLQDTLRYKGA